MTRPTIAVLLLMLATTSEAHEPAGHGGDGATVNSVVPGSPAEAAGLQAGDVISRFAGERFATTGDLEKLKATHKPGETVPVIVVRNGEEVGLSLTFGKRPEGGISIGVAVGLLSESSMPGASPHGATGSATGSGTAKCLAWIDETYRIESISGDLGIEIAEAFETMQACVSHDTSRMATADAVRYCDNVFKVHCSGLDLLTEIGEGLLDRCDASLEGSLGIRLQRHRSWTTCAESKLFDRYSNSGISSDAATCRSALLDECGSNIDAMREVGDLSEERRMFVDCCLADDLDGARERCAMIDEGFERGPCHDREICLDRFSGDWLTCAGS